MTPVRVQAGPQPGQQPGPPQDPLIAEFEAQKKKQRAPAAPAIDPLIAEYEASRRPSVPDTAIARVVREQREMDAPPRVPNPALDYTKLRPVEFSQAPERPATPPSFDNALTRSAPTPRLAGKAPIVVQPPRSAEPQTTVPLPANIAAAERHRLRFGRAPAQVATEPAEEGKPEATVTVGRPLSGIGRIVPALASSPEGAEDLDRIMADPNLQTRIGARLAAIHAPEGYSFDPAATGSLEDALAAGLRGELGPRTPRATSLPGRVAQTAGEMALHPLQTAAGIATAPFHAAYTLGRFARQETDLAIWGPNAKMEGRHLERTISPEQAAWAAGQVLVPGVVGKFLPQLDAVFGRVMARAVVSAVEHGESPTKALLAGYAAHVATHAAGGAAIGGVYAPDDPAVGAILGAAIGGAFASKDTKASIGIPVDRDLTAAAVRAGRPRLQGPPGKPATATARVAETPPVATDAPYSVEMNTPAEAARARAMPPDVRPGAVSMEIPANVERTKPVVDTPVWTPPVPPPVAAPATKAPASDLHFPMTVDHLANYAKTKGVSIADAATALRDAGYKVSDDVVQEATKSVETATATPAATKPAQPVETKPVATDKKPATFTRDEEARTKQLKADIDAQAESIAEMRAELASEKMQGQSPARRRLFESDIAREELILQRMHDQAAGTKREEPSDFRAREYGSVEAYERRQADLKEVERENAAGKTQQPEKHEFSSTQVNLPPEAAKAITALGARIPDADLAKDGREDAPHVTVKYGLHGNEPEKVRKLLAGEPPITLSLGKTSIFPNGESNSGDVVKVDVDSPDLHRINKKIADALPHTDTHPEYKPHATIAYVKPGLGKKYEGDASLEGTKFTIDRIVFSGKDGTTTEIPLGGAVSPSKSTAPAPKEEAPDAPKWKELGQNADGHTVYEDSRGVRSIVRDGVRVTEPVLVIPRREGNVDIGVDRPHKPEWTVAHDNYITPGGASREPSTVTTEGLIRELASRRIRYPSETNDIRVELKRRGVDPDAATRPSTESKPPAVAPADEKAQTTPKEEAPRETPRAEATERSDRSEPRGGEPSRPGDVRPDVAGGTEGERPGRLRQPGERRDSPTTGARGGSPRGGDVRPDVERSGTEPPSPGGVREESPTPERTGEPGEGDRAGGPPAEERGGSESGDRGVRRPRGDKPAKPDAEVKGTDFRITDRDEIGEGGERTKARANIDAITLALDLEKSGRVATREEQATLAKYVGWGGLKGAFEPRGDSFFGDINRQLRELLSAEEYADASRSALNAHYTSPLVVAEVWRAMERMGFTGGQALEPGVGVGNFLGLIPDALKSKTQFTGIERDRITALIAKHLYPRQNVVRSPFEAASLMNDAFDLAIGNPPFGDIPVFDQSYPKAMTQRIHDYFFIKSLDKVRPGGLIGFITSDGTMDKSTSTVRRAIAEKADLVAAIRLPNTAFKKNAGTQVTTDIIFLKKRAPGTPQGGDAWADAVTYIGKEGQNFKINEYYAKHPEQMLGDMDFGGLYRADDQRLVPRAGQDLGDALKAAIDRLPTGQFVPRELDSRTKGARTSNIPAVEGVRDGGLKVVGKKIMRREGNEMVEAGVPESRRERVTALIGIREAANLVRRINVESGSDEVLLGAQKELNKRYDAFVKKYGPINAEQRTESKPDEDGNVRVTVTLPNLSSFLTDPDAPIVRALERYDYEAHQEDPKGYRPKKADSMTRRTIAPPKAVERAESAPDALLVSLNDRGRVDLEHMASLLGQDVGEVRTALKGQIFKDPQTGLWDTIEGYTSGDVKKKLAIAEAAAAANPEFAENVEALKKAIPADLAPSQIGVALGAPWIPASDYTAFLRAILKPSGRNFRVTYNPFDSSFTIDGYEKWDRYSAEATSTYGTGRIHGFKLAQAALNRTHPIVYDPGDPPTKNIEQTLLADEKAERIKEEFARWIWSDANRATRLVRDYNDRFNTIRLRAHDGKHLTMPGVATHVGGVPFEWQPHQRNFIARYLYDGRAAAFHVVGAGKTFAAIGAVMEAKRLGLARKPLISVPNHMLGQWASEFLQLYPGANLLLATEKDFEAGRRKEFTARIASSDYDSVIMTHSGMERVPVSKAAQERYVTEEMDELDELIRETHGDRNLLRDLENAKARLEVRLEEIRAASKKDDLLDFEELGIDLLVVDEAHMFKNLRFNTRLKGIGGRPSQRAVDLELKLRHIHKVNPKHGAMLLTGTPISNSMAEVYVMQRFMQPELLRERGIFKFDAWANTYAMEALAMEMSPSGDGFVNKSRFQKFINLGELAQMFRSFADVQMAHPDPLKSGEKAMNLPVEPNYIRLERPPIIGGKAEMIVAPPTPQMKAFMKGLVERARRIRGRKPAKGEDNFLAITNDGRLGALDLRLVQHSKDSADSKLSIAADKIAEIYKDSAPYKGAQLVFADAIQATAAAGTGFHVYRDVVAKLEARGVKRSEIAIIHDYDTGAQKLELFTRVREGKVRVLIGSTEKMGAGTNVQTRLVALHHLDVRWRPSDVEQREGRILRQGNELYKNGTIKGVRILRYVSEGSLDAFMWGLVGRKAGFIHQGMTADATVREIEDVDEQALGYAEIAAAASGDPRIMERAQLDAEVQKLDRLRRAHEDEAFRARSDLHHLQSRLPLLNERLEALKKDAERAEDTHGDKFTITIDGTTYTERKPAGEALVAPIAALGPGQVRGLGTFAGFKLSAERILDTRYLVLDGAMRHDVGVQAGDALIAKLEYIPRAIPERIEKVAADITETESHIERFQSVIGKPFEHAEALKEKGAKLRELNVALSADKQAQPPSPPGGTPPDEDIEDFEDSDGDDVSDSPATPGVGARLRSRVFGATAATDKVLSLAKISRNLANMAGVPLRQGRFNARLRKAAGVFIHKREVTRVLRYDRLDTAAHEVGHYVSKRYLGNPTRKGKSGILTPEMKKELVTLGKALYGTRKPTMGYGEEGIAEWASFYVTDPVKLVTDAPKFSQWMETTVFPKEPELKAAMDQARRDFADYQKAPATARIDAIMDVNPKRRALSDIRSLVVGWLDDLAEIRLADEELTELGGATSPAKNAYILSRLSRGSSGMAEEMVLRGVINPLDGKRVTRGVAEILRELKPEDVQPFRRYLVAERALEVIPRGIDPGISYADASDVVKLYGTKYRALAEDVWEISQALIEYREAKGLLTPEEAKEIKDKNQRRVGFYRVFDETETAASRGWGKGFGRNSSGVQRMKGSSRDIIDPLESLITDIYKTVKQSHGAEVLSALVKHAENTEGGGRVVEVLLETPQIVTRIPVDQIKQQLDALGFLVPGGGLGTVPGIITAFTDAYQAGPKEQKDLVRPLVINGERKWIQIKDAKLFDALSGLGTPEMPNWLRWLSIPTRTLRAGATLTLEFMTRNPARDAVAAAIYTRAGGLHQIPGFSFARGLFHVLKHDEMYQRWRLEGGDNAAMLGLDRVDVQKHVKDLMRSPGKVAADWVIHPIDTLRMLSSLFENATRAGEFAGVEAKARGRGAAPKQAAVEGAMASRDVTIDFARAGTIGRQVNQLMAFFNANAQGWDKLGRELRERPHVIIPRLLAWITLPSIILYLLQKDDEAYQEVPAWQKTMAWVIVDRDEQGEVSHIWRIPKPPDIGILFGTVPERMMAWIDEHDPKALDRLRHDLSTLNPVHLPEAIKPLVEWWANKSTFTDRQIVPEGLEALPAAEQATSRTGETARLVGGATNLSPAKIENTVRGYAGGLGQYGLDIGNQIVRSSRSLLDMPPLPRPPERSGDQLATKPLLRGFTIRNPELDAQSIQDALNAFERAESHRLAWRRKLKEGDQEGATDYFDAHEHEIVSAAASTDGIRQPSGRKGQGALRVAHDLIIAAQRASKGAEQDKRQEMADQALNAARLALKAEPIPRQLRRAVLREDAEVRRTQAKRTRLRPPPAR